MTYLIIISILLILYCYYLYCRKKSHSLTTYRSVDTTPLPPKKLYYDKIDYVMYPLAQATRLENAPKPDKKKLYNTYNEAVKRYNRVYSQIRKHPQVPNIETVVTHRDRAYLELLTAHVNQEETAPLIREHRVTTPVVEPPVVTTVVTPVVEPPVVAIKTVPKKEKLKVEVKSSAQNVHDHNVNDELSKRYQTLKSSTEGKITDEDNKDMLNFISQIKGTDKILTNLACQDTLSRFDDDTEQKIWLTVWKRIHLAENNSNRDSLLLAFKNAIEDCEEDGYLVCTTGRVTRVLDSLTLLDKNPQISSPIKTDDIERKETYEAAHKILQRELDKKGTEYKKAYEEDKLEDTTEFDKHVKECISNELKESKFKDDAIAAI